MNKKEIIIILISFIVVLLIAMFLFKDNNKIVDENTLYTKQFKNVVLKFKKYDYALGQKILVGVEKSTDRGKTFKMVSDEYISVSNEARFLFIDENIGFAISTKDINRNNNYIGFKVTHDGGKTFKDAVFNYVNDRVSIITIEDLPYYEDNILKLECSIYDIKSDGAGYEYIKLIFESNDGGLTWDLEG